MHTIGLIVLSFPSLGLNFATKDSQIIGCKSCILYFHLSLFLSFFLRKSLYNEDTNHTYQEKKKKRIPIMELLSFYQPGMVICGWCTAQ